MPDASQVNINNRYQVQRKLGQGGMGVVYEAYDRLNRQAVALKCVLKSSHELSGGSSSIRVDLAHEFQVLASLHHPHIINVLDYGFDQDRQPYFTMTLLRQPRTIVETGIGASLEKQVQWLIDMLQALAYLHRHQIIHRDLKPDNALVDQDDHLKVLDFGLSMLRQQESPDDSESLSGTMAYMAPEIFQGGTYTELSDLYAVGVIAYEIFAGIHPFASDNLSTLINDIMFAPVDLDVLDIPPALVEVIDRLMAKEPDQRYASANEVISTLNTAMNQEIATGETGDIRESYLQAAPLVGREQELARLDQAIVQMLAGRGSAWLIGGESGVGKSRILDEIRTRAMVKHILVLHGQAAAGGGLSYQIWRDVLRRLALTSSLTQADASVLKQLVPDMSQLLEQDIPDAPELEGQAGQQRLLNVIVNTIRQQSQPLLIILEDLHWTVEGLDVLRRLNSLCAEMPLMLVGSYRDDELPGLPAELPEMQLVSLKRFSGAEMTRLSVAMLGEAGQRSDIQKLLQKETEGNVFFLVEVVRALSDQLGGLAAVGRKALPTTIFAGGIERVIRHRLQRVSPEALALLHVAALAGRLVDLKLLHTIAPTIDLDDWLSECSNAAVLDVLNEQWRFAHEKLREGLVAMLDVDTRRTLHRQIADSLSRVYTVEVDEYAAVIADHYVQAEAGAEAANWSVRAAKHADSVYATQSAVQFYQQALELQEKYQVQVEDAPRWFCDIYRGLGDGLSWQAQYDAAINIFTKMRTAAASPVDEARALLGIATAFIYQGDFNRATDYASQVETIAHHSDIRSELAKALFLKGWNAFRLGDAQTATRIGHEVITLCEETGNRKQMAQCFNLLGGIQYTLGQYLKASDYFEQALAISQELDDRGPAMALINNLGVIADGRGDYETARQRYRQALSVAETIGMRDAEMLYRSNLGGVCVRLEQYAEAEQLLNETIQYATKVRFGQIAETYRFLAELYLGKELPDQALATASLALAEGRSIQSPDYIAATWRVLGQIAAAVEGGIVISLQEGASPEVCTYSYCFGESLRIYTEAGMQAGRARTLREWAKASRAAGEIETGQAQWQEARALFVQLGADYEVERMPDFS